MNEEELLAIAEARVRLPLRAEANAVRGFTSSRAALGRTPQAVLAWIDKNEEAIKVWVERLELTPREQARLHQVYARHSEKARGFLMAPDHSAVRLTLQLLSELDAVLSSAEVRLTGGPNAGGPNAAAPEVARNAAVARASIKDLRRVTSRLVGMDTQEALHKIDEVDTHDEIRHALARIEAAIG